MYKYTKEIVARNWHELFEGDYIQMKNKYNERWEQLLEFIINEEEDNARELFHSLVVEKSKNIYESLIDEDEHEFEVSDDQVGDFASDIEGDEEGMDMNHNDDDMDDGEEESEEFEDVIARIEELEVAFDELEAKYEEGIGDDESDDDSDDDDSDDSDDDESEEEEEVADEEEWDEEEESEETGSELDDLEESLDSFIREYTEKVNIDTTDKSNGKPGPVAGKNTVLSSKANPENIVRGDKEKSTHKPKVKDMNTDFANKGGKKSKLQSVNHKSQKGDGTA